MSKREGTFVACSVCNEDNDEIVNLISLRVLCSQGQITFVTFLRGAEANYAEIYWKLRKPVEKSPPLWGRDNEGGKASDWSRIQNPAF